MISIKEELGQRQITQDILIHNKTDSLGIETRLKIGCIKETKIYLSIFLKIRNIWACCTDALTRDEK